MTENASSAPQSDPSAQYVFGIALDGTGSGSAIENGDVETERAHWLHVDYSVPGIRDWLEALKLDPQVVDSLVRQETRPRAFRTSAGLLLNVRGINFNPGADPEDMVSLRMWIEPHRLISVRQRRIMAVQDVRADLEAGNGPETVAELVGCIVERLADRIGAFVDTTEDRVINFEKAVETADAAALRNDVAALRRQIAVVRRFLAPQRDALETFYRLAENVFSTSDSFALREQSDRITRYVEDLDLVRERALVIQEELMNRISQEQNNRMYVLSIVAAVFLPISFISGFFGMNTGGLPGVDRPIGTLFVVLLMVLITGTTLLYFKRKHWL